MDIGTLVVILWLAKIIQNGVTDVTALSKGQVPPRWKQRAEKARPAPGGPGRYRWRDYWSDLWHDAAVDARAHRRQVRQERTEGVRPTWGQRWRRFWRLLWQPTGARTIDPEPAQAPVPAPPAVAGRVCPDCGVRLVEQAGGWTHPHAADPCPPVTSIAGPAVPPATPHPPGTATRKGTTMTAPTTTDEITSLETAEVAFSALGGVLAHMQDLANQLEAARDRAAGIAATIHEGCETNQLDATTMDGIDSLLAGMSPASFGAFSERIEDAQESATATRKHMQAVYGDAAETVAATGVRGTFLEPTR